MSKASKSPTRQTKLTFKRVSKNNLNAYEQMQSTQLTAADLVAPPAAAATMTTAATTATSGKMQVNLSASKIRLQTVQTVQTPTPDAVRRKSAPQLFSFSIAPQLVTTVGEAQMVPRLPAYELSNCIRRSRTLGLPMEHPISGTDSNSDPSSSITGGSSTSPESLLDNILSGASSISVQSSSGSDITVAPPPPPPHHCHSCHPKAS